MCRRATGQLEASHSEPIALLRAKGELATKAGFLVTLVASNDPDDPEKIRRLIGAAAELGLEI
jgi:hypothetical protein